MDTSNKKPRSDLLSYFLKNSIPTEGNFADLINGTLNQKDDGVVKLQNQPLAIIADNNSNPLQKIIDFYQKLDDTKTNLAWSLQLNPSPDGKPDSAPKANGFCVADGQTGLPRLFIDKATGNLGLGTITPIAPLDIAQEKRTDTHPISLSGLYVTGNFGPASNGVEFRNSSGTQGIGFGYNTIYAAGSNAHQELNINPKGNFPLRILGKGNFSDGEGGFADPEAKMKSGSLMIGSLTQSFGGETGYQNNSNLAGLLLQTGKKTEIVVHHYGKRLVSLMYYDNDDVGDKPKIEIGRNIGSTGEPYGATPVVIAGDLTAHNGIDVSGYRTTHLEGDGTFYRKIDESSGQGNCYITLDATLYVRAMGATAGFCSIDPINGRFNNSSDIRLKKEITDMTNMLEKVLSLQGVFFKWKDNPSDEKQLGLIAQEVSKIFPELVSVDQEEMMSINYNGFIPLLIEAIKEQQIQIQQLFAFAKSKYSYCLEGTPRQTEIYKN